MQIEKLDSKHLKITLEPTDMIKYNISFKKLEYSDEHSRNVIKEILKRAYSLTGFVYTKCRLLIEVLPTSDSGCVLYFTRMRDKDPVKLRIKNHSAQTIFRFKNSADLIQCAEKLSNCNFCPNFDNSLYCYKNKYYLIVSTKFTLSKKVLMFLCEFSDKCPPIQKAIVAERGFLVQKENALAKIGAAMQKDKTIQIV